MTLVLIEGEMEFFMKSMITKNDQASRYRNSLYRWFIKVGECCEKGFMTVSHFLENNFLERRSMTV